MAKDAACFSVIPGNPPSAEKHSQALDAPEFGPLAISCADGSWEQVT